MVLVTYSDSEADSDINDNPPVDVKPPSTQINTRPQKRKALDPPQPAHENRSRPPPLPKTFHSLYATNVRTSTTDDPSLHGGRKRQVIHVQGNWPTHAYLEWHPTKSQTTQLETLISRVQDLINNHNHANANAHPQPTPTLNPNHQLNSFLRSSLDAPLPLHISLSAPIILPTRTKDTFHDALATAITRAGIGRIRVRVTELDLVPNFEGSRWFLVLRVTGDGLSMVLDVCNGVCTEFGLDGLYLGGQGVVGVRTAGGGVQGSTVSSLFHFSIAWLLGEVGGVVREGIRELDVRSLMGDWVEFDKVMLKIGNVVDAVTL